MSPRRLPSPRATHDSGSAAIATGRWVSLWMISSSPVSSAPPPVSTMPLSTMSAAISGGVRSSDERTVATMPARQSCTASATSSPVITIAFGTRATTSLPFTSMRCGPPLAGPAPSMNLISSARRSPTIML